MDEKQQLLLTVERLKEELTEKDTKLRWLAEERDSLLEQLEQLKQKNQEQSQLLSLVQEESPSYGTESLFPFTESYSNSSPLSQAMYTSSSSSMTLSPTPSRSSVKLEEKVLVSEPVLKEDSKDIRVGEFVENPNAKSPEEMLETLKAKRASLDKKITLLEQMLKDAKKKKHKRTSSDKADARKTRANTLENTPDMSEPSPITKEWEQNESEEIKEIVDGKTVILGGTLQQLVNRLSGAAIGKLTKSVLLFLVLTHF